MLARAQCQPFVLMWCSLIYFLWGPSLLLCSSENLISNSKRHSGVRFKEQDEFPCMIRLSAIYPCPSKHIQLRTDPDGEVFLIDLEQEVNWGRTNVLIIWGRTMATLHFSAGSADARILFTSQFNAMWQKKFIEHLLHAKQMCRAKKGNKKVSFL